MYSTICTHEELLELFFIFVYQRIKLKCFFYMVRCKMSVAYFHFDIGVTKYFL